MFWMTISTAHIDEPRLDVHLSFRVFSRVTWHLSVLNHCGETHVEKINDQLWDYSVINGIFLNFLPSVTGNEITGWYVLIFLHTLLVRELDLRCLCGSLVRTGSRINHWGIFVPSIAYHWYSENESRIIPETLQHVHVRKTKASFKFLMDYSQKNTQSALPLLSLKA